MDSIVMGFKNSPQILQRIMNNILNVVRVNGIEVYIDGIIVYSQTREKHGRLLLELLRGLGSTR